MPARAEYWDVRGWLGRPFDPEAFDPKLVQFEDPMERLALVLGED